MEKLTKEQIKGPDAFISSIDKAWETLEKYRKMLMVSVVAIAAAGAGYTIFSWQTGKKEAAAQADYYIAKKALLDAQKNLQPAEPPQIDSKNKQKPQEVSKKTGDIEKDYGSALSALEGVIQKHPSTKAAAMSAIELTPIFFEYKQNERALKDLEAAAKAISHKDFLYGFVLLQLGNAQQALGKCEIAVESWKKITESKHHAFLHPDAMLNSALCYESLNQKDRASDLYRKLSQDFSDTDAGRSAKTYLRLLTNAKS